MQSLCDRTIGVNEFLETRSCKVELMGRGCETKVERGRQIPTGRLVDCLSAVPAAATAEKQAPEINSRRSAEIECHRESGGREHRPEVVAWDPTQGVSSDVCSRNEILRQNCTRYGKGTVDVDHKTSAERWQRKADRR